MIKIKEAKSEVFHDCSSVGIRVKHGDVSRDLNKAENMELSNCKLGGKKYQSVNI